MKSNSVPALVVAMLLGTSGCASPERHAGEIAVRDSSGATIVINPGIDNDAPTAGLAEDPLLSVGVGEGNPAEQFTDIVGAVRTASGAVVVADGRTRELRFFGPDGTYQQAVGGEGGGPSEFRRIGWFGRIGHDTLGAFDPTTRRLSLYSAAGDARGYVALGTPADGFAEMVGVLGSDRAIVLRSPRTGGDLSSGVQRDTLVYVSYDLSGTLRDTITEAPGPERIVRIQGSNINVLTPPFALFTVAAVSHDRVLTAGSTEYRIDAHDGTGTFTQSTRRRVTPVPLTGSAIDEFLRELPNESVRRSLSDAVAELPRPRDLPVIDALLADDDGGFWVRENRSVGTTDAARWAEFDREGRLVRQTTFPRNFEPTQFGDGFVLGIWRDESDVETVRLYSLEEE